MAAASQAASGEFDSRRLLHEKSTPTGAFFMEQAKTLGLSLMASSREGVRAETEFSFWEMAHDRRFRGEAEETLVALLLFAKNTSSFFGDNRG